MVFPLKKDIETKAISPLSKYVKHSANTWKKGKMNVQISLLLFSNSTFL